MRAEKKEAGEGKCPCESVQKKATSGKYTCGMQVYRYSGMLCSQRFLRGNVSHSAEPAYAFY